MNAVAHKDYSGGAPIQIKVFKDRIMIWNDGQLPANWTITHLLKRHASKPFNPDIANTLFRSGYIESWGRGIEKMLNYCLEKLHYCPKIKSNIVSKSVIKILSVDIKTNLKNYYLFSRSLSTVFTKCRLQPASLS